MPSRPCQSRLARCAAARGAGAEGGTWRRVTGLPGGAAAPDGEPGLSLVERRAGREGQPPERPHVAPRAEDAAAAHEVAAGEGRRQPARAPSTRAEKLAAADAGAPPRGRAARSLPIVGVRCPALRPLAPKPAISRSTTATLRPRARSASAAERPVRPAPRTA